MPEIQIKKVADIKKGSYIWYNNKVYEVVEIEFSKTGKHGSAKARIVAISLDGEKVEIIKPTQDPIEVPVINKIRGVVISILGEDKAMVMDNETYETHECKIHKDLIGKIKEGQKVLVWDMGEKIIIQGFKE